MPKNIERQTTQQDDVIKIAGPETNKWYLAILLQIDLSRSVPRSRPKQVKNPVWVYCGSVAHQWKANTIKINVFVFTLNSLNAVMCCELYNLVKKSIGRLRN